MTLPNDWKVKSCLQLSVVILLAMLSLIGLANLGLHIPGLRQAVGFVFLTFVPGILILRILRIHNVSVTESLIYSVGLSLAFVMFSGALANFVLHSLGVSKPVSAFPMTATLAVFILVLCGIAYKRDRDWDDASSTASHFDLRKIISPPYLLLLLLPFVAVLGSQFVNFYENNLLLLFFIPIVACVVALFAFDRLPQNAYPFAIVMIGLSLLLHFSLISSQLNGGDIHGEYYYQNLVMLNGYWDSTITGNLNTALSIVMLCPIYSVVLNIDSIWVFKIIYPLIFCLAPLALFRIFGQQIGVRKAFLAAFFFMATPMFLASTWGVRNQVAQLFFALLILLVVDRKLALKQRTALFILFTLSLVVSHYGLGIIAIAFLVGSWITVALIRSKAGGIWGWLTSKSGGMPYGIRADKAFPAKIAVGIIGIYLLFGLVWYGTIAQGTVLDTIRGLGEQQYSLLSTEITHLTEPTEPAEPTEPMEPSPYLEPELKEELIHTAFGLDFFSVSGLGQAFRIFQYITQLFIVIGFIKLVLRPKRFKAEYVGLAAVAALILLACVVIPRFSSYLTVPRFYHICLLLLAPLCILGGEVVWHGLSRLFGLAFYRLKAIRGLALETSARGNNSAYLGFLALGILIPYFLFNSGFFFEVTGSEQFAVNDSPSSMALSSHRLDMAVFSQEDADAAIYLSQIMDDTDLVYADTWGTLILNERSAGHVCILPDSGEVPEEAYVFLRTRNVDKQEILVVVHHGVQTEFKHASLGDMAALLEGRQIIHDNGGAQIWGPKTTD